MIINSFDLKGDLYIISTGAVIARYAKYESQIKQINVITKDTRN